MSAISQGQPKQLDSQIEANEINGDDLIADSIDATIMSSEVNEIINDIISERSSSSSEVSESDIRKTEQLIEQSRLEDEYELGKPENQDLDQKAVITSKDTATFSINIWSIIQKSAINLFLPFINGMMLGFGEILAHEVGFRYNWVGAKVQPPRRLQKKQNASKFL